MAARVITSTDKKLTGCIVYAKPEVKKSIKLYRGKQVVCLFPIERIIKGRIMNSHNTIMLAPIKNK